MTPCALTSCHVVISKQWEAVCRGRPVEQVCNRKGTTWYEYNAVRFRQSGQSESRVEPWIRSRSEAFGRLWRYRLQVGASVSTHWIQKEDMGKKKSPLWVYVSPYLSQTNNKLCAPFENKMRERFFIKKCVSFRSLKFVYYFWLCSCLILCNNSKASQVSRTLPRIPADLYNDVVIILLFESFSHRC